MEEIPRLPRLKANNSIFSTCENLTELAGALGTNYYYTFPRTLMYLGLYDVNPLVL
jgi:hypothetical protein